MARPDLQPAWLPHTMRHVLCFLLTGLSAMQHAEATYLGSGPKGTFYGDPSGAGATNGERVTESMEVVTSAELRLNSHIGECDCKEACFC